MEFMSAVKSALKKSWKLSILTGAATYAVAWAIQAIKLEPITVTAAVVDVRAQILSQGNAPALGNKVLAILQGYLPQLQDFMGVTGLLLGTYLIVTIGMILVETGNWSNRLIKGNAIRKSALTLAVGALAGAVVLGAVTGIGFWTVFVAMLIYYIGISILMSLALRFKPLAKFVS